MGLAHAVLFLLGGSVGRMLGYDLVVRRRSPAMTHP
jgi:hypothetical protein